MGGAPDAEFHQYGQEPGISGVVVAAAAGGGGDAGRKLDVTESGNQRRAGLDESVNRENVYGWDSEAEAGRRLAEIFLGEERGNGGNEGGDGDGEFEGWVCVSGGLAVSDPVGWQRGCGGVGEGGVGGGSAEVTGGMEEGEGRGG